MPVYEYECASCQKVHEVQQKITDEPLAACPDCGGEVKKLISMSSFHLKGGGWYADGYAKGGNGKNGKDKSAADSASGKQETPPCAGGGASCKSCPAATS